LSYFTGKYNFRQGFGTGEGFVSDGRRSLRRVTFFHQQKKVTKERRLKPAVLRIPSRERCAENHRKSLPREMPHRIFPLAENCIDFRLTRSAAYRSKL
jgi:hypothetical protein